MIETLRNWAILVVASLLIAYLVDILAKGG